MIYKKLLKDLGKVEKKILILNLKIKELRKELNKSRKRFYK